MLGPQAVTARQLSRETGGTQSSLSHWLRRAKVRSMSDEQKKGNTMEIRPEDWTAAEKLAAVMEASALTDSELKVSFSVAKGCTTRIGRNGGRQRSTL